MDFFGWVVRLGQHSPWKRKIHGKSVSTSVFLGVWFLVDFFLERGFTSRGKTKIHGKKSAVKLHGFTECTLPKENRVENK